MQIKEQVNLPTYPYNQSRIHNGVIRGLELAEKLRQIKPLLTREQRLKQLAEKSKARQKYARRQWNGKKQMWEKVWKPYPPTDPFRAWE